MKEEDILKICGANPTNKYICQHLDDNTLYLCMDILSQLDADEFKEINPNAEFDFTCLPIPYESVSSTNCVRNVIYSKEVNHEFNDLLEKINTQGTNLEYSYLLLGYKGEKEKYFDFLPMNKGSSQSVEYDWNKIEQFLSKDVDDINFSIFHTHPKEIDKEHNTLYNKHKDIFGKIGIKPGGLNISVSDIYANQYLDMLCEKYHKNFIPESTILMHDGNLISFSTKNGVEITCEQKLELNKTRK